MELGQLAQKPKLVKLTIDKKEIVEKYGDALEFYMYDRQPLDVFAKLANFEQNDSGSIIHLLQTVILDANGEAVMKDGLQLPMDVVTECIKVAGETLGK
jgi:hypothetical protein